MLNNDKYDKIELIAVKKLLGSRVLIELKT